MNGKTGNRRRIANVAARRSVAYIPVPAFRAVLRLV